uniref:Uncharacterized protein n=1 Tax=Vitis vinifera TaxID=29760 RepID=F6GSU9_VITVI
MATLRLLLVFVALLVFLAQISSDFNIEGEEMPFVSQVVVRGGNRRLMQDIGGDSFFPFCFHRNDVA